MKVIPSLQPFAAILSLRLIFKKSNYCIPVFGGSSLSEHSAGLSTLDFASRPCIGYSSRLIPIRLRSAFLIAV